MMPDTGSTVCFLSAYALRPTFVLSRYAMHSAVVAGFGQRYSFSEALAPSHVVFAPSYGNERFDTGLFAGCDIPGTIKTAICQQLARLAQGFGQDRPLLQHRLNLFLIVGGLYHHRGYGQHAAGIYRRLGVIGLFEDTGMMRDSSSVRLI